MAIALVAAGLSAAAAPPAHATGGCQVDYRVTSQWPTGFVADLTLRNLGAPWNGWTLTFRWPGNQQITEAPWNAGSWSQTGRDVRIGNARWNGTVAAGGAVSGVGFVGSSSGTNSPPTNFAVNGIACTGQPPTPQLVVSRTNLNLTAGGLAIYTVRLSSPPTADVLVTSTRRHGATCISVTSGAQLTFTPEFWNFEQEVRLSAGPGCSGSATFAVRSRGMGTVNVSATSTVPQTQQLIVEPTTLVVDAVTNAYTIVLAMQPATDVLVTSTRIAGPDCIDVVSETNPWLFSPTDWFVPRHTVIMAHSGCTGVATIAVESAGLPTVHVFATAATP